MSIDAKPWPGGGGAASVPDATETTAGKIRIATSAEATTGTDDTIAMTPLTVKERIDAAVTGGVEYKGTFNATAGTPSLLNAEKGDLYIIDTVGTIYGQTWAVGDHLLINEDMGGSITNSKIDKIDNTDAVTSVNTLTGPVVLSADDLEGDHAGVNYVGLATDTIDVHLSGIDTALASVGGNQLVRADIKNTSFNADRNSFYRIGTDALTMTMPSSGLSEGDLIGVYAVSSNEFDLTVSGNLVTINATSVSSVTIKVNKRSIMLWVYDASTSRWVQTSDSLDTGSSSDAGIFKVATNAEAEAATIVDKVLVPGLMPYVDLSTLDNDLSADDFPADHLASNYTPANANIDGHLSGIDTALGLAGGLSAVVDDTTPQLGGPLDVNGQAITSASNGDVAINPDGTGDISIGADIIPDADATHTIGDEDNRFISLYSDVNGALRFKAKNDEGAQITKGQVVYIKGIAGDGETPTVGLADSDDASKMPAFGLAFNTANDQAEIQIVFSGNLYGLNTSGFSVGDTLFVGTSAGGLTETKPTGETAQLQNIGRVIRSNNGAGVIMVGGAGRSAATPNLNDGKIFLGNASNQAVSTALSSINLTSFNDDLGSTYQPLDAGLTSISGLTTSADKMIYTTASDTYEVTSLTSAGRAILDDADATAQRTTLGLGTAATEDVGTGANNVVQLDGSSRLPAVDGSQLTNLPSGASDLNGLSDVTISTPAGGNLLENNGSGQFVNVAKSTINVGDFNDDSTYQPLDTGLTSIAGLTTSANQMLYTTGSDTYDVTSLTAAGRAILDDADAAAQRTTLGLGTAATSASTDFLASTAGLDDLSDVSFTAGAGIDNYVLTYDHSTTSWGAEASQGGGGGFTYSAITADPAPAVKDTHYSCTGTFTITLPAVSGTTAGDQIRVKNIGTGTVTIDGASSETVDGSTTFAMDVRWSAVTLVSNGSTGWEIV
jgi:hypothetical protein